MAFVFDQVLRGKISTFKIVLVGQYRTEKVLSERHPFNVLALLFVIAADRQIIDIPAFIVVGKFGVPVLIFHTLRMAYALSLIHISEPTRRTPISYAVFCLKKK